MSKKEKKKKLDSIPKIHRRLYKLWSEAVRERDSHSCIYCGIKSGELNHNNNKTKCDAHHCLTRDTAGSPLRYDIRNGVSLCPSHHKFSSEVSAHKSPIVFYDWLRKNRQEQYDFILNHSSIKVDLDNRMVLQEIESCLINKRYINIQRLIEIEKQYPRQTKKIDNENILFEKDEKEEKNEKN